MDVLTDLLQRSRASGAAFARIDGPRRVGIAVPGRRRARHARDRRGLGVAVARRRARRGAPARRRHRADPRRQPPPPRPRARRRVPPDRRAADAGNGRLRTGRLGAEDDGLSAAFFCGAYLFEGDLCAPLLEALPPRHAAAPGRPRGARCAARSICSPPRCSATTPASRRCSIGCSTSRSSRSSARTSQLRRRCAGMVPRCWATRAIDAALSAIHADPAHAVDGRGAGRARAMSRSAFARRFTEIVGVDPAARTSATGGWPWRASGCATTGPASRRSRRSLGYASEFSFAAAFKRHTGMAPGRWRARARATVACDDVG